MCDEGRGQIEKETRLSRAEKEAWISSHQQWGVTEGSSGESMARLAGQTPKK